MGNPRSRGGARVVLRDWTRGQPVTSRTGAERLGWAMRVVAFLCVLVQATAVLLDASWQATSWSCTTAGAALALVVGAWATRRHRRDDDRSPREDHEVA